MVDYLIVGGGVSGLAAAYYLQKAGFSVVVLESEPQAGGKIQTLCHENGYQVDLGANTLMVTRPEVDELLTDLHLEARIQVANTLANKRFVVKDGRLVALPMGVMSAILTPLISWKDKFGMLWEPFLSRTGHEESIGEFVERRLGESFLKWIIDPFVSGIYAGDPRRLSLQAAFPKMYLMEKDHGSIFKGAFAFIKARKAAKARGEAQASKRLMSFDGGLQVLPQALAQAIGSAFQADARVEKIEHLGDYHYRVTTLSGQSYEARHLVLSTPAGITAELLKDLAPNSAKILAKLVYPKVALVALGFDASQIKHPLDGFGVLIPRHLGIKTLGALFSTTLFPQRAPQGKVLISSYIGGRATPLPNDWQAGDIAQQVTEDLRPLLGISGEPEFVEVKIWHQAIPQYEIGHLDRVQAIRDGLKPLKGLTTRANWHEGIAMSDTLAAAKRFAEVAKAERQVDERLAQGDL